MNLSVIVSPPGTPVTNPDPVWAHDARTWLTNMALQVALFAGFALLTWWRLLRIGPGRRR